MQFLNLSGNSVLRIGEPPRPFLSRRGFIGRREKLKDRFFSTKTPGCPEAVTEIFYEIELYATDRQPPAGQPGPGRKLN